MSSIDTRSGYNEWIADIVTDDEERIPEEGYHMVAEQCVVAPEKMEEKTVLQFAATPWTGDRLWPKQVLDNTPTEYPYEMFHDGLRDLAVAVVAHDIKRELEDNNE